MVMRPERDISLARARAREGEVLLTIWGIENRHDVGEALISALGNERFYPLANDRPGDLVATISPRGLISPDVKIPRA